MNRCAKVEIRDFWVPTIEMYLLVEILLEIRVCLFTVFFVFCWFSSVCTGGITQISPSVSKIVG